MLQNGYDAAHWEETKAKFDTQRTRADALGLVEDVRNRGFDRVMLTPALAHRLKKSPEPTLERSPVILPLVCPDSTLLHCIRRGLRAPNGRRGIADRSITVRFMSAHHVTQNGRAQKKMQLFEYQTQN